MSGLRAAAFSLAIAQALVGARAVAADRTVVIVTTGAFDRETLARVAGELTAAGYAPRIVARAVASQADDLLAQGPAAVLVLEHTETPTAVTLRSRRPGEPQWQVRSFPSHASDGDARELGIRLAEFLRSQFPDLPPAPAAPVAEPTLVIAEKPPTPSRFEPEISLGVGVAGDLDGVAPQFGPAVRVGARVARALLPRLSWTGAFGPGTQPIPEGEITLSRQLLLVELGFPVLTTDRVWLVLAPCGGAMRLAATGRAAPGYADESSIVWSSAVAARASAGLRIAPGIGVELDGGLTWLLPPGNLEVADRVAAKVGAPMFVVTAGVVWRP